MKLCAFHKEMRGVKKTCFPPANARTLPCFHKRPKRYVFPIIKPNERLSNTDMRSNFRKSDFFEGKAQRRGAAGYGSGLFLSFRYERGALEDSF